MVGEMEELPGVGGISRHSPIMYPDRPLLQ